MYPCGSRVPICALDIVNGNEKAYGRQPVSKNSVVEIRKYEHPGVLHPGVLHQ